MIIIFVCLIRYFDRERNIRASESKLTDWQRKRLKTENLITWTFAIFYMMRIMVTDLGYTVFLGIYYYDEERTPKDYDIENFPMGENSPLPLVIYTLDFFICMILLVLFYMYAKKASDDEEKLKRYYLISVGLNQFLSESESGELPETYEEEIHNYGRGGLAGLHKNHKKNELGNDSFIKKQNQNQRIVSGIDYTQMINKKLM